MFGVEDLAAVADLWSELLRAQQRRIEMCRL